MLIPLSLSLEIKSKHPSSFPLGDPSDPEGGDGLGIRLRTNSLTIHLWGKGKGGYLPLVSFPCHLLKLHLKRVLEKMRKGQRSYSIVILSQ
jgi:hypothetical protein